VAVAASVPANYTWISNDAGATWLTTSPQSLYVRFYRGNLEVASQEIIGTRNDGTGAITLTAGAHSGEAVDISTFPAPSQVISATVTHALSQAQSYVAFSASTDTTALGGYTGGGGK
jgi:hypothetical protein